MRPRVNWFIFLGVLLLIFVAFRPGSPAAADDQFAMIGTWTDEAGEPGNSIRFYLVERDLGTGPIKAFEGHATLVKFLGKETAKANWNSGSRDPSVVNFSIGKQNWYIQLRELDEDHILVRFGRNAEEIYRNGALEHPDAKVLTRIAR